MAARSNFDFFSGFFFQLFFQSNFVLKKTISQKIFCMLNSVFCVHNAVLDTLSWILNSFSTAPFSSLACLYMPKKIFLWHVYICLDQCRIIKKINFKINQFWKIWPKLKIFRYITSERQLQDSSGRFWCIINARSVQLLVLWVPTQNFAEDNLRKKINFLLMEKHLSYNFHIWNGKMPIIEISYNFPYIWKYMARSFSYMESLWLKVLFILGR